MEGPGVGGGAVLDWLFVEGAVLGELIEAAEVPLLEDEGEALLQEEFGVELVGGYIRDEDDLKVTDSFSVGAFR